MNQPFNPPFKLCLLTLALIGAPVYAADEAVELDTIEVTATSAGITPRTTRQSVDKGNVVDMKDVLQNQSGVAVSSGNGMSQQLYIRSMGENQLTFTVDNAGQAAQNFHHQSRFMFDPAFLKSINIEKGSGSASAGIGVTGGAIRMTTVNGADLLADGQSVGARVGAGIRSNKGWERSLAVYGQSGGFDGILMGNWITQNDYKSGNGDRIAYSGTEQRGYMGKLRWRLNEDHQIAFTQRREQDKGDRPLRLNLVELRAASPFHHNITQDTSNLEYQGRNVGFVDKIDANIYRIKARDRKDAVDSSADLGRLVAHSDGYAESIGANLGLTSSFGNGHQIKYGLNWRREEVGVKQYSVGRGQENKTDWGVYAEGIWNLDPVTLTTGLRYDRFSFTNTSNQHRSGGVLNPSIAAIWDVSPAFALHASVAQASRSPRLYESYILGMATGDQYVAEEGLKPEKALNTEIGFQWHQGHFGVSGSLYQQTIRDYLNTDLPQENMGKLKTKGYELNGMYQNGGWLARLGVAESKPKLNGEYYAWALDVMPTGRQWLTSLAYTFERPALEIGWRGRYTEAYEYNLNGQNHRLPGYGVHDLYANWQPLKKDTLNVNFAVNNVGNKQYVSQSTFRSARTGIADVPPENGRDFRLSVNYRF